MDVREYGSRFLTALGVALISVQATPSPAAAQIVKQLPPVPLAQLLPDLILREVTLQSPPVPPGIPGIPAGFTHEAHFSPLDSEDLNNPVVGIVQSFNRQMATQFSTFPLGSSSGGLTYTFDETVGTFRRSSNSFGPLFAERALTIGRRKLSVGFNYQHTSYDTFEGQDLNGWLGSEEYEYWVTAPAALVPRVVEALGGSPGDDVLDLLADHADEIVLRGESTWLRSLGIDPDIHVETSG